MKTEWYIFMSINVHRKTPNGNCLLHKVNFIKGFAILKISTVVYSTKCNTNTHVNELLDASKSTRLKNIISLKYHCGVSIFWSAPKLNISPSSFAHAVFTTFSNPPPVDRGFLLFPGEHSRILLSLLWFLLSVQWTSTSRFSLSGFPGLAHRANRFHWMYFLSR